MQSEATETLLAGDSVSRMQVTVREGFVTLPLRCAQCQKSNDSKSSYVLSGVVHRFFHSLRGKCFELVVDEGFKFQPPKSFPVQVDSEDL